MDHLNVVAGASLTDPVTAGLTIGLGGDSLEDRLDRLPGGRVTTGHERGTVAGTLLTTRDTRANEENTLLLELLGAADGVGEVRVTTVNDDITLLHVGQELVNEGIDSRASLDKKDDLARALQLGAKLLDGVGADNVGACVKEDIFTCQPKKNSFSTPKKHARSGVPRV